MHAFLLTRPLPHSHALLVDHQQGLAWRSSSSRVSSSRMTSKGANQLMSTKPREGLCGMLHITSIRCPKADWVTKQCSGNITKTLLNFCLSLSLCLPLHLSLAISTGVPSVFPPSLTPPPMSQSQLSVLPKSNSCCGVR